LSLKIASEHRRAAGLRGRGWRRGLDDNPLEAGTCMKDYSLYYYDNRLEEAEVKELLNQASGMDRLDDHLDRELDQLARAANSPEFAEGLHAFFEKRAPIFTGLEADERGEPTAPGARPEPADRQSGREA